jgi:hypothetical protein
MNRPGFSSASYKRMGLRQVSIRILTTDGELIKELSLHTENNYQKQ